MIVMFSRLGQIAQKYKFIIIAGWVILTVCNRSPHRYFSSQSIISVGIGVNSETVELVAIAPFSEI
jgi:hypothetical protein